MSQSSLRRSSAERNATIKYQPPKQSFQNVLAMINICILHVFLKYLFVKKKDMKEKFDQDNSSWYNMLKYQTTICE